MKEEILKRIIENSDKEYKEFHSNLCPGVNNILGVRVPKLRSLAKEIVQEGKQFEYLEIKQLDYYEEIMLQGMLIGFIKNDIEEVKKQLKKFVPKIDNWAICDVTCSGLKITKKYEKEMWEFILKYLNSKKTYEVRFVIVMMLDFFINEQYIDRVLEILRKERIDDYYVKMAIAWAISIAYIKYPEKTLAVLESNELSDFTHNKAIQKINESYRVDRLKKEELKLKRR